MAYPRAFLLLLPLPVYYLCFTAPHHSAAALNFSYNFSAKPSDLNDTNLQWLGDSHPSVDHIAIDLTNLAQWSKGRVAYKKPVRLWDGGKNASFTTDFSFAISDDNKNDRGDGMAFFIGPYPPTMPRDSDGSFLGLFNNRTNDPSLPQTVGVEFDTCWSKGTDPPDVTDHIGIDVNDIRSTNYTQLPNLALSGTMSATVNYDAGTNVMSVRLVANGRPYDVSTRVDLMAAGVPQDATVGFSAATGGYVESHQLLSWSFSSTDMGSSKVGRRRMIILIAAASASLVVVAALVYGYFRFSGKVPGRTRNQMDIENTKLDIENTKFPLSLENLAVPREFSYQELSAATDNFSKQRLGAGSFGIVYRGDLPDGKKVAVKKLNMAPGELYSKEQIISGYVTEIKILCKIFHQNLVRLVGWCADDDDDKALLLVYELVENGNLNKHLHDPERLLTWEKRYKIVLDIGSAIEYLHTGCENPILHRDIKPSNVMLDGEYLAKLGDFGLVRQASVRGYLEGTTMIGSLNYVDPVCFSSSKASTASDMYSFGVLLLEVASGKALEKKEAGLSGALINDVKKSYAKGAVLEMADPRLKGDFDKSQMERVLLMGLLCVQPERQHRPRIREVANWLSNPKDRVPEEVLENLSAALAADPNL